MDGIGRGHLSRKPRHLWVALYRSVCYEELVQRVEGTNDMRPSSSESQIGAAIVGLLWRNPRIANAFSTKSKGWDMLVSEALGISPALVAETLRAVGERTLTAAVANNPAGEVMRGRTRAVLCYQSVETEDCPTRIFCPTSECGTSSAYCPTVRGCG